MDGQREGQREEGRAGVLGRPRHLDHHPLAQGALRRRRGHRVLRRRRPGRRLRGGEGEGPRDRRLEVHRQGPARGVRPRLLLQGALRGRRLRGPLPARHGPRAAAARLPPGPGGDQGEGRRPRPRGDRQGQRPGPVRGHLRRLRAAHEGDRALAGVDDPLARGCARLRAPARRSRRADEEGPLQPRRQPVAPLPRGRQPRGRMGRAAEGDVQADRRPARRPGQASAHRPRLRARASP